MKIRFLECNEFQLLYTFKHEQLFVSTNKHPFEINDHFVFLVNKKLAAVAKLASNDLKLSFTHMFEESERMLLIGKLRDILFQEWGIETEDKIGQAHALSSESSEMFMEELKNFPDSFGFYLMEIDYLLEEEEKKQHKKEKKEVKKEKPTKPPSSLDEDASEHTKAQFYLRELATITECDIWTASNDKNRLIKGEKLGDDDLENFPNFQIPFEAKKRIRLIDTIWFKGDYPLCAFEVECTTSVYSGLLRLADLASVMPNKEIKLYIVAPMKRKGKVMSELNRPIFKAIGLNQYCRFIPMEQLELLYEKAKGLDGHLLYTVIDIIAQEVEETEEEQVFSQGEEFLL